MSDRQSSNAYWQANLKLIWLCMIIWALVSYGFGIILRPILAGISVEEPTWGSGSRSRARSWSSSR